MDGAAVKNLDQYKERMAKTMNRAEKLFFLDHLNMSQYKTIIDFGGASGRLIHEIDKVCPDFAGTYIIVDNNPQMETEYKMDNCIRFLSLDKAEAYIKDWSPSDNLLICSSVLHECGTEVVSALAEFCQKYIKTIVIRDMHYEGELYTIPMSRERYLKDWFLSRQIGIIKNSEAYPRFLEHLDKCVEWQMTPAAMMAMWILKCDYKENWVNEVQENYFNNNIALLTDTLLGQTSCSWLKLYDRAYPLPYKASQARTEYHYVLPNTHRQIILTKKEEF